MLMYYVYSHAFLEEPEKDWAKCSKRLRESVHLCDE